MLYVISDIHGQYEMFMKALEKISFSSRDTLYILGDAMDRGEKSLECMRYIMSHSNIVYILGNHDLMFLTYYYGQFNMGIFEEGIFDSKYEMIQRGLSTWCNNGGKTTLNELKGGITLARQLYDYLLSCPLSESVMLNGTKYTLSHSLYCCEPISEETIHEAVLKFNNYRDTTYGAIEYAVWERVKSSYSSSLKDSVHVFGHTISKKYHADGSYLPYCEVDGQPVTVRELQMLRPKSNAMVGIDTGCAVVSRHSKDRNDRQHRPRLTSLRLNDLAFTYTYRPKKNI